MAKARTKEITKRKTFSGRCRHCNAKSGVVQTPAQVDAWFDAHVCPALGQGSVAVATRTIEQQAEASTADRRTQMDAFLESVEAEYQLKRRFASEGQRRHMPTSSRPRVDELTGNDFGD